MPSLFQLIQLAFAAFILLIVAERVRALCLEAATSDDALRWLVRSLEAGMLDGPRAFARERPRSYVARVLELAIAPAPDDRDQSDEGLRERLGDLREEAVARLLVLRVSATLASTLGLLGGILVLAGTRGEAGLVAPRVGTDRAGLAEAIVTMAIGVATSAVCFQSLALLRPAAQKLLDQAHRTARAAGFAESGR